MHLALLDVQCVVLVLDLIAVHVLGGIIWQEPLVYSALALVETVPQIILAFLVFKIFGSILILACLVHNIVNNASTIPIVHNV